MKLSPCNILGAAAAAVFTFATATAESVKVGVLHSLSGTMAISETSLRDTLLFAFDEINAAGGIKAGGKTYTIEPVIVDGDTVELDDGRKIDVALIDATLSEELDKIRAQGAAQLTRLDEAAKMFRDMATAAERTQDGTSW